MSVAADLPVVPAAELPISEARTHIADVVNLAAYAGRITYLTRHGHRVALVASTAALAAERAKAREAAITDVCQALWQTATDAGASETTLANLRTTIDQLLSDAEEATDAAAIDAAEADEDETIPWETLTAQLNL